MENDKYSILEVTDKQGEEPKLLIAYAVESDDTPRFKDLITVPADKPKDEILVLVNDRAFIQLELHREKAEKEAKERGTQENLKLKMTALKAELENMKGPGIQIEKPKQKKKQLQSPEQA